MAVTKIKPIRGTIEKSIAYIIAPGKTEDCQYVFSEHCIPETAAIEFQYYLSKAQAGGNTIGRHLMQSFAPGEVTPEQAHEIGKRLADEILGGQYAYILSTHVDRDHIHNHFIWCAVNIETHRRYISNKASYHKIQDASDRLCSEYGLSVITEKSGCRGKSYTEYQADRQGTSWKSLLRRTINMAIEHTASFDEFLAFMQEAGYEVKRGKYISFRATGQERFTRAKTIGDHYTEERIRERIARPKRMPKYFSPAIQKMIDRSGVKFASSPGLNRWAVTQNLKVMAVTLIYLQENFKGSLTALEQRYQECESACANAREAYNQAARQLLSNSTDTGEILTRHDALKKSYVKEYSALRTELAELKRVRDNLIATTGEKFYQQHSRTRKGGAR